MPSIILSDNGVSSGSAGIKTTGGNDGVLALQTTTSGGTATTAVTIDTSQNVGVGVTPSAWTSPTMQFGSDTSFGPFGYLRNGYYDGSNFKYISSTAASRYAQSGGQHLWFSAASGTAGNAITFTQAMTLDASGNLLVGTTTAGGVGNTLYKFSGGTYTVSNTSSTTLNHHIFQYNSSTVGTISTTTTATSYVTSSDYRLKNSVTPMTGALAKVASLNPVTYKWNVDGSDGEGFIAHELQAVVPNAVTGEKDAVETYLDDEGNEQTRPVYQGIDTSFLVATLTAAIQEQQALITTLTERISALEAK
jgi:hypothetical protein